MTIVAVTVTAEPPPDEAVVVTGGAAVVTGGCVTGAALEASTFYEIRDATNVVVVVVGLTGAAVEVTGAVGVLKGKKSGQHEKRAHVVVTMGTVGAAVPDLNHRLILEI